MIRLAQIDSGIYRITHVLWIFCASNAMTMSYEQPPFCRRDWLKEQSAEHMTKVVFTKYFTTKPKIFVLVLIGLLQCFSLINRSDLLWYSGDEWLSRVLPDWATPIPSRNRPRDCSSRFERSQLLGAEPLTLCSLFLIYSSIGRLCSRRRGLRSILVHHVPAHWYEPKYDGKNMEDITIYTLISAV